jgi:hypothetical protein
MNDEQLSNEEWARKHEDKFKPVFVALVERYGPALKDKKFSFMLMRHKTGVEFGVIRFDGFDWWIDPTTGELQHEMVKGQG